MKLFNLFNQKGALPPEPPRTPLGKVHFIVHPGDGVNSRNAQTEKFLMDEIAERAIHLDTRHELAIVLLQMSEQALEDARDPSFQGKERALIDAIRRMETELPENLIVIPGAGTVREPYIVNTLTKIRKEVGRLGFAIDPKTHLLTYGEMATICVPTATANMARDFNLTQAPTIDLNYTDVRVTEPEKWTRNGFRFSFAQTWNSGIRYIPIGEKDAA